MVSRMICKSPSLGRVLQTAFSVKKELTSSSHCNTPHHMINTDAPYLQQSRNWKFERPPTARIVATWNQEDDAQIEGERIFWARSNYQMNHYMRPPYSTTKFKTQMARLRVSESQSAQRLEQAVVPLPVQVQVDGIFVLRWNFGSVRWECMLRVIVGYRNRNWTLEVRFV